MMLSTFHYFQKRFFILTFSLLGSALLFPFLTAEAKHRKTKKPDISHKDADELFQSMKKELCEISPPSPLCDQFTDFLSANIPQFPVDSYFTLGPAIVAPQNKSKNAYLVLFSQEKAKKMGWFTLYSDTEQEEKDTKEYITSLEEGKRRETQEIHTFLTEQIKKQTLFDTKILSNSLVFTNQGSNAAPFAAFVRQKENKFFVLITTVSTAGGMDIAPQMILASGPFLHDSLPRPNP